MPTPSRRDALKWFAGLLLGAAPGLAALWPRKAKAAKPVPVIPKPFGYLKPPMRCDYAQTLMLKEISGYEAFSDAFRRFLRECDCGCRLIQLRTSTANAQLIRDWIANRATTEGCDPFLRASLVVYFLAHHGLALEVRDDGVWSENVAADLYCSFDAPQTQRGVITPSEHDPEKNVDFTRAVGDRFGPDLIVTFGMRPGRSMVDVRPTKAGRELLRMLDLVWCPGESGDGITRFGCSRRFDFTNSEHVRTFATLNHAVVMTKKSTAHWLAWVEFLRCNHATFARTVVADPELLESVSQAYRNTDLLKLPVVA